ncbi:MAG: universal stress protein [Candidatus Acidiferrum sp.]
MSGFAPKSILCPLDISSAAPKVLRWASLLSRSSSAKLQILHAHWVEYPPYFLPSQTEELAAEAERNSRGIRDNLEALIKENIPANTPYEITILEGHPVETILKYAEVHKSDLIVMGSHGRSGHARMGLGSVAEHVLQQTSSPTLLVRAPEGKAVPSKISRILCPVTFDEHAIQCISLSAAVAVTFGAQLIVMHSEEEATSPGVRKKQLCEWVPAEVRDRCELIEVIRQGSAAEQILLAAREHDVNIIVLAARHRRFFDFTVIGTTTEKVMRHADSTVLVLPVRGGKHD